MNEESLLEEESYQIEAEIEEQDEGPQTPPEVNVAIEENEILTSAKEHNQAARNMLSGKKAKKRRREERKSKKRKSRKRHHEELGPRPEPKINLEKLELDVVRLLEDAASSGKTKI